MGLHKTFRGGINGNALFIMTSFYLRSHDYDALRMREAGAKCGNSHSLFWKVVGFCKFFSLLDNSKLRVGL